MRAVHLVPVFNVVCVMCSRSAGQVMQGQFVQREKTRAPIAGRSGSRCGECGGNLYLEPEEAITAFMAKQIVATRVPAMAASLQAAA